MGDITVLGGGVNGITTALMLEVLGHDTTLYTRERADKEMDTETPEFASTWGAGAIAWPVMVEGDNLRKLFHDSQKFYGILNRSASMGIRRQKIYTVSENSVDRPDHSDLLLGAKKLEKNERKPSRTGKNPEAYQSEIYFAEMPFYMQRMYQLYLNSGGDIVEQELTREQFLEKSELAINCSGYESRELFNDHKLKALKGYLLKVQDAPIPKTGEKVAGYTYDTEETGTLYCFPRNDALILGGTHLEGTPEPGGEWKGEEIEEETVEVDGMKIPERILKENNDILGNFAEIDIEEFEVRSGAGYRPYREKGVRIEEEKFEGTLVIHNYGHGGSGISLSWGSAQEVAEKIGEGKEKELQDPLLKRIRKKHRQLI